MVFGGFGVLVGLQGIESSGLRVSVFVFWWGLPLHIQ